MSKAKTAKYSLWDLLDEIREFCSDVEILLHGDAPSLRQYNFESPNPQLTPLSSENPTGVTITFDSQGIKLAPGPWFGEVESRLEAADVLEQGDRIQASLPDGTIVIARPGDEGAEIEILELTAIVKGSIAGIITKYLREEIGVPETAEIKIAYLGDQNRMYEVETKVEVTFAERTRLVAFLEGAGFEAKDLELQHDYYVEARESPFGGWDLRRYREQSGTVLYTEKTWEVIDGSPARNEFERLSSMEEMHVAVGKNPQTTKIQKFRHPFVGKYQGKEIHVDMDSIQFDHSPAVRYFVEAELIAANAEQVAPYRALVRAFLKEALGVSELKEAPGMFTMAFEKR